MESFLFYNLFRNGESLNALLNRRSSITKLPFKVKSDFVKEPIPDDVFETMLGRLYEVGVGRAAIYLVPYGGKLNEILESVIPFPHRARNLYMIHPLVNWVEEEEEEELVSC